MSDTTVSLLTPPGTGAIATVAVSGPRAWEFARKLFRPAGKPLPDEPELHRFWFGRLGDGAGDEVILAVTAEDETPPHPEHLASRGVPTSPPGERSRWSSNPDSSTDVPRPHLSPGGEVGEVRAADETGEGVFTPNVTVEVHCHGGRRVVRWVVEQFVALGALEGEPRRNDVVLELLQHAPTLRTASILLDQLHGAFDAEVRRILGLIDTDIRAALAALRELAGFAPVGRHLVAPWKVVIAGPPNVGKSSLVNALAGYQRAVVSEVAGTTRDAVSVPLAFDGWPVELTDTAGLRDAEGLEAEGIERAKRVLAEADLVVWVMDCSAVEVVWPDPNYPRERLLVVFNKSDLPPAETFGLLALSAKTGAGVPELVAEMIRRLVPSPPPAGAAVPYTPALADAVEAALAASSVEAVRLLRELLGRDKPGRSPNG